MKKKMTKAMALEIINKYCEKDYTKYFENQREKFLVKYCVTEDSILKVRMRCETCGNVIEEKWNQGYKRRYYNTNQETYCPCCGKNYSIIGKDDGITPRDYAAIYEIDNGICFVLYHVYYTVNSSNEGNFVITSVKKTDAGLFDYDAGWFVKTSVMSNTFKGPKTTENHIKYIWKRDLNVFTPISKPFCDIYNEIEKRTAELRENPSDKKKTEEIAMLEARKNYQAAELKNEQFISVLDDIFYYLESSNIKGKTYRAVCPRCGKKYSVNNSIDNFECECGASVHPTRWNLDSKTNETKIFVLFENTTLPENDLLVRLVRFKYEYDKRFDKFEYEVSEYIRFFMSDKLRVFEYTEQIYSGEKIESPQFVHIDQKLIERMQKNAYPLAIDGKTQSEQEIVDVVNKSAMIHSGILEAYGLGDKRYNSVSDLNSVGYIVAWGKNPHIELTLKANMTAFTMDVINNQYAIGRGNTLDKVLKLPKNMVRTVIKLNPDYKTVKDIGVLAHENCQIDESVIRFVNAYHIDASILAEIYREYGINYIQAIKFLDSAYDHQCIDRIDALNIWKDYLFMAKAAKMDLTSNSQKFPMSLKKEHDIAQFAYNSVKMEIDRNMFSEQAKKNKTRYAYEDENLIAMVPESPEEITYEASRQHNCLRSYIERVKSGNTVVLFVRKKSNPTMNYVTVEIFHNRMVQLKGYCNTDPRDDKLNKFVENWAKEKKFILAY